jgi:hypothetical protein
VQVNFGCNLDSQQLLAEEEDLVGSNMQQQVASTSETPLPLAPRGEEKEEGNKQQLLDKITSMDFDHKVEVLVPDSVSKTFNRETSSDHYHHTEGGRNLLPPEWQIHRTSGIDNSIESNIKAILMTQMREPFNSHLQDLELMNLLQKCLETDQKAGWMSTVVLAANVRHFESRKEEDLGWGCGWRNIQMLSFHLMMQDPHMKDVLFGGAGFVPDILALQNWLEVAWAKGFDLAGADYFGWHIRGTRKWIGTTECAALLRSFGVRARIVDFQCAARKKKGIVAIGDDHGKCGISNSERTRRQQQQQQLSSSAAIQDNHAIELGERERERVHGIVVCFSSYSNSLILCSEITHVGENLCCFLLWVCTCAENGLQWYDQKRGEDDGRQEEELSQKPDIIVSSNHRHLVDWVWNYFMDMPGESKSLTPTLAFDPVRKPMICSRRSPLYFQHRGHSRTIVGIERQQRQQGATAATHDDELFLIVFDPSQKTEDIARALKGRKGWQRLLKRGIRSLKHAEYQLCYIDEGIAYGEEWESLKFLTSVHYTY